MLSHQPESSRQSRSSETLSRRRRCMPSMLRSRPRSPEQPQPRPPSRPPVPRPPRRQQHPPSGAGGQGQGHEGREGMKMTIILVRDASGVSHRFHTTCTPCDCRQAARLFTVISGGNDLATVEREARAAVADGREARGHGDSSRAHLIPCAHGPRETDDIYMPWT